MDTPLPSPAEVEPPHPQRGDEGDGEEGALKRHADPWAGFLQ